MLYLVATPIGNLGDISYRAVKTLLECDLILCEDRRRASILLNHYQVKKPLKSFHSFSEKKLEEEVISLLKADQEIALISDAGTPLISDPGSALVKRCIQEGLLITSLPGACAVICAFTLSGLETERFQFLGFLPKKESELKRALSSALLYPGVSIFYETPHHLEETLKLLPPNQEIVLARELTKLHEELARGKAQDLRENVTLKGEFVLLLEGKPPSFDPKMPIKAFVEKLQGDYDLTLKEAIKLAAELTEQKKQDIYRDVHL